MSLSADQAQVKANVGSVVAALDSLITQCENNAAWNASHGASISPGMLNDTAEVLAPLREQLFALFEGADDLSGVS